MRSETGSRLNTRLFPRRNSFVMRSGPHVLMRNITAKCPTLGTLHSTGRPREYLGSTVTLPAVFQHPRVCQFPKAADLDIKQFFSADRPLGLHSMLSRQPNAVTAQRASPRTRSYKRLHHRCGDVNSYYGIVVGFNCPADPVTRRDHKS